MKKKTGERVILQVCKHRKFFFTAGKLEGLKNNLYMKNNAKNGRHVGENSKQPWKKRRTTTQDVRLKIKSTATDKNQNTA